MKKVYSEIGIGNKSFLSTEYESNNNEYRVNKLVFPDKLKEIYFRVWIRKSLLIISFFKGIKLTKKDKSKFKLVFGFGGLSN